MPQPGGRWQKTGAPQNQRGILRLLNGFVSDEMIECLGKVVEGHRGVEVVGDHLLEVAVGVGGHGNL